MFTDSTPLEEKEDENVNGYEYPDILEQRAKEDLYDKASLEYDLTLNDDTGYETRTIIAKKNILGSMTTSIEGNECGWILEYYFGLFIAPQYYNTEAIQPSPDKYFNSTLYFDKWDFRGSNWTAEIKVQSKTNFQTGKKHTKKRYGIQASKFIDHLPTTEIFDVWWGEIDNYDDLLDNRKCPSNWKRFHCTQEEWKKYKIVNNEGLYIYKYNKEYEMDILNKVASWSNDQYGLSYGPQLYFDEDSPYLESINITIDDI